LPFLAQNDPVWGKDQKDQKDQKDHDIYQKDLIF